MPGYSPVSGQVVQILPVAVFQKVLFPGPVHILLNLEKVQGYGVKLYPVRVRRSEAYRLAGDLFVAFLIIGDKPLHHGVQGVVLNKRNVRQVENRF